LEDGLIRVEGDTPMIVTGIVFFGLFLLVFGGIFAGWMHTLDVERKSLSEGISQLLADLIFPKPESR
jgi:hypothetical protein